LAFEQKQFILEDIRLNDRQLCRFGYVAVYILLHVRNLYKYRKTGHLYISQNTHRLNRITMCTKKASLVLRVQGCALVYVGAYLVI